MKTITKLIFLAIFFAAVFTIPQGVKSDPEIMYNLSVSMNMNYGTIGTIVYGEQPTKDELIEIIEAGADVIVRMNGNGKDSGGMSIEEEARICADNGARLMFINAHMGYIKGRGYVKSGELISDIMKDGNVFLHCLHGFDRTGHVMAVYLNRVLGWSAKEIILLNGWETYLIDKSEGDYYKYYESLNY